jgi:DNA-binding LacI/PurR family transcriptional regulator
MSQPATIYEVAMLAGVSISTVSLAMNRPDRVAESTRRRVLAAADQLGFVPKAAAVSRARRGVGRVGVVAPVTSYGSYMRRLAGVLEGFRDEAVEVCVYDERSAATASSPLLSSLPITGRLDGVIVMGLQLQDEVVDRLAAQSVPAVLVDVTHPRLSSVVTDDTEGGRLAARHLLDRGHRSFAVLQEASTAPPEIALQGNHRYAGFLETVAAAGVPAASVSTLHVEHDVEKAAAGIAALLATGPRPDAVFCHDDTLAVGALLAVRAAGLRGPEDVAVMGFDDGDAAVAAGLTTVRQPFEESGRIAARALTALMARAPEPRTVTTLSLEVVPRTTA